MLQMRSTPDHQDRVDVEAAGVTEVGDKSAREMLF
jgi:hypothetical protein